MKRLLLVFTALGFVACSSSSSSPSGRRCAEQPPPAGSGYSSENADGQCGAPLLLTGTAAPGAPCQSDTDCAPTCCACATGSKSALVAQCLTADGGSGLCATADQACCAFEAHPPAACQ